MTFKFVFRSLKEVFPQVDLRILKAVAIEHSKDVDAAVEFVLSEVLPSLSGPIKASYTLDDAHESEYSPAEVVVEKTDISSQRQGAEEENASLLPGPSVARETDPCYDHIYDSHDWLSFLEEVRKGSIVEVNEPNLSFHHQVERVNASLPSEPMSMECGTAAPSDHPTDVFHFKSQIFDGTVVAPSSSNVRNHYQLVSSAEPEEQVTSADHIARSFQRIAKNGCSALNANVEELYATEASGTAISVCSSPQTFYSFLEESMDLKGFGTVLENNMNYNVSEHEERVSRCSAKTANIQDFCDLLANNSVSDAITSQDISSFVLEDTLDPLMSGSLLDSAIDGSLNENGPQKSSGLTENGSCETDTVSVVDNDKSTAIATQSGHVIGIEFLEDFITDVKGNKKTLMSALDLVTSMMNDVELHEERAKQAKEEATKAGQDTLNKVNDLRQMLNHAKEANDKHAGEIYGEKIILATEAWELQSRLLNLSDEIVESISRIEEIQQTLETRLAAAEEKRAAAEQEKLENEEVALKILREQELVMDNLVQESKRLQEEAEENTKIREFLMDRGRIVDILKGEITVACKDVTLLKERADSHVPLIGSPPSTACSLVSSSHHGSMSGEKVIHPVDLGEDPRMMIGSGELPGSQQPECITSNTGKAISDDDWEIFDFKVELQP